jgi:RES domain-containing protein
MARSVYRVCRARYARLDGEGARLVGGRWNSPGSAVVYMAERVALAVLENLVHMIRRRCFTLIPACFARIDLTHASQPPDRAGPGADL